MEKPKSAKSSIYINLAQWRDKYFLVFNLHLYDNAYYMVCASVFCYRVVSLSILMRALRNILWNFEEKDESTSTKRTKRAHRTAAGLNPSAAEIAGMDEVPTDHMKRRDILNKKFRRKGASMTVDSSAGCLKLIVRVHRPLTKACLHIGGGVSKVKSTI